MEDCVPMWEACKCIRRWGISIHVLWVVTHFLGLSILFSRDRLGELLIFLGRQRPWEAIMVGLGVVKTFVSTTDTSEMREYSLFVKEFGVMARTVSSHLSVQIISVLNRAVYEQGDRGFNSTQYRGWLRLEGLISVFVATFYAHVGAIPVFSSPEPKAHKVSL